MSRHLYPLFSWPLLLSASLLYVVTKLVMG